MAEAVVEERQLLKGLTWFDGFVIGLSIPAAAFASLGFSIAALGALAAILIWGVSMLIGALQNWIYSETAAMFPDKSGGIALYAHEGWRRHCTLVGPIATFGYWFAWSSVLSIFGLVIGGLIQTQWFPDVTWTVWDGFVHVGLPQFIAAGVILAVWFFNVFGMRLAMWVSYVIAALLLIPFVIFIIAPFLTGNWHGSNLHWHLGSSGSSLTVALVWLYIAGWTTYGIELSASFAPEYRDTVRDTSRALKSVALFTLGIYVLLPLGVSGTLSEKAVAADPVGFYASAFDQIVGGASNLMVVLVITSLLLVMNMATADGSRALYGIAKDGMTIKQLLHLNKRHVPGRAMTLDMVVNLCLVFFVASPLSILVAGNLGYIAAHFFALTGFLLLRKDRPKWPRPIKLHSAWVAIALGLAALNVVLIVVANLNSQISGYGGPKETWIGVGVLLFSIVLFVFRRVVQDREPIAFREEAPAIPVLEAEGAAASID